MKFQAKIEEQIARYQKEALGASDNEEFRLNGKIEGLRAALMYWHSRDSWGNETHKPGRLGSSE